MGQRETQEERVPSRSTNRLLTMRMMKVMKILAKKKLRLLKRR
jgi:hypothetical protein